MTRSSLAFCLVSLCCLLSVGCSGKPSRVSQPGYSSGAGSAAISAYDTNGDSALSGDELERVPALREALGTIDTDSDNRLTASEIDARVDTWRESRIGKMEASCEVILDGSPLADAEVVFEPEPFLGSGLPSGNAKTYADGVASTSMPPGFYKIRVTHPQKQIPARYNTETTLGFEVANYSHWQNSGAMKLILKSK